VAATVFFATVMPFQDDGLLSASPQDLSPCYCDQAIRLKPDVGLPFYNRGLARRKLGDKHGAEQDFARANRLGFKPA
jgi:hypothetical protein